MCYTLRWGRPWPSLGLTGGKNETLVEQSRAMFILNVSKYKSSEEKRHRLWVSKPWTLKQTKRAKKGWRDLKERGRDRSEQGQWLGRPHMTRDMCEEKWRRGTVDRLEVSDEVGRRFNTAGKQELLYKYSIVIIFNIYIYKQKNNQKEFTIFSFYLCRRTFLALSACCFLFPQGENETQSSTSTSSWV